MKTTPSTQPWLQPTLAALAAGAATAVLSFTVLPVAAQTTTGSSTTGTTAATASPSDAGKLDRADHSMIRNLAEAQMAEIAAAKVALEKSSNAEVKRFAQQMVDGHTSALADVQALATAKGATLPTDAGMLAKTKLTAMKALSGTLFDKEYAKHAGVGDHEDTLKLLKKIQTEAKDADLKALAGKMLPEVQRHLDMAKALAPTR